MSLILDIVVTGLPVFQLTPVVTGPPVFKLVFIYLFITFFRVDKIK